MSASTDLHPQPGPAPEPHDQVHEHPSDRKYVMVAAILAVITAAEVSTYFWEDASTAALVATLFPMMIAKFAIVCGYFMHLRYDNPLFRRVFVFGLVLAVAVYTAALAAMEFFA
jgi:cytochrome c oxidase subunit 4